ncbi:MAG: glycosyltransferase [Pirellulaceae bacterium]
MPTVSMIVWNEFLNDARVLKEAQTLEAAGYQVTVHALLEPGLTYEKESISPGINVVRVARNPFWRFQRRIEGKHAKRSSQSRFGQFLKLIARSWTHLVLAIRLLFSRPDAIHAHDVNVLPTAWLAARVARIPLVYDAHEISTSREGYKAFRSLVGGLEKRIMPRAAATITTTAARAKFFARAYRIPRPVVLQNRPRLIRNEPSACIREELGLTEPWPIVLYQGGLQSGRGLPMLVRAAEHIPDAYFVFIGGGRLEAELRALTETLGLNERVYFIRTVALAKLPSYTASADIGVQPIENTCLNHFTTDSNKLFEYVMAGLPVVASRLPEIRRVVQAHELGLLVSPGNRGELIAALRRLVSDSDLRTHYAANARNAAKTLNWESQEQALLDLYESILHPKR